MESYDPSGVDDDLVPLPDAQMPEALVALAIGQDDVFLGAVYDDLLVAVKSSANAVRVGPWGGTQLSGSQAPLVVGAEGSLLNGPLTIVPGANMQSNTDASLWAIAAFNVDPGVDCAIGLALSNAATGVATWLTGDGAPRPSLWSFSNTGGDTSFNGDALVVTWDRLVGINWPAPEFQLDVQGALNVWSNVAGPFQAIVATNHGNWEDSDNVTWIPGDAVFTLSNTGFQSSAEGCLATLSLSPDSVAALSNSIELDHENGVPTPLVCLATPTVVASFGADEALFSLTPTVYADQVAQLLQGGDLSIWDGNLLMQNGLPIVTSNGLVSNVTVGSFSNAVIAKRGFYFEGVPLSLVTTGVGNGVGLGLNAADGSTTGPWNLTTAGWDLVIQNASNAACFTSSPPEVSVDFNDENGTGPPYRTLVTIGPDARINGPSCNVTTRCNLTVDCNLLVRGRAAFSNAVTMSSNLGVSTAISIGPAACDNSYPFKVQTVNANNISIYAAGDIASFSDARYKDEIRRIDHALDKVDAIGGYTFQRHGENTSRTRMAGVLAQEVAAVLPEVVSADPDGMMHVSYGNIVALLIEAIKELREESAVESFRFVAVREGEPFEFACKRRRAVISPEDGFGRCCARVVDSLSSTTLSVVGRVELPGAYAIAVY